MFGELSGGIVTPQKNVTICACICPVNNETYAVGYCDGVGDHS